MSNTMAASWLCKKTNVKELNFFDFCKIDTEVEENENNDNNENSIDKYEGEIKKEDDKNKYEDNENKIKNKSNSIEENKITEEINNNEENQNTEKDKINDEKENNEENKSNEENVDKKGNKNNISVTTINTDDNENNNKLINEPVRKINLYPSCWRNFFTSINLLRVLQMITKRKLHRILALVQWKTSAVLKRILRVNHIGIQLYALKLLKSQIPFLGKKWKSSNMRIITSIYLNLRPDIQDDYLCNDNEVDVDDALYQEQQLRNIIAHYHKRMFPKITIDSENDNNSNSDNQQKVVVDNIEDDFSSRLNLSDTSMKNDINNNYENLVLDDNFMNNYEAWLNQEVWQNSEDEFNNEISSIEDLHHSSEKILGDILFRFVYFRYRFSFFSNKKNK